MFNVIFAIVAIVYTSYLAYVRIKKVPVMKKYKRGTQAYEIYSKIYSPQFLNIAIVSTLFFIADVVFEFIRHAGRPNIYVLFFFLAVRMIGAGVVLFMFYKLFAGTREKLKKLKKS